MQGEGKEEVRGARRGEGNSGWGMEAVQGCIRWVAEELCGRTSGERRYTEMQKPMMVDGRGGERSGGEAGSMEYDSRH